MDVCGRRGDPCQGLARIRVARLQALEIEDGQAAQSGQRAGERGIDDGVHGRGEDRNGERDAAYFGGCVDVCRVESLGAWRKGDIVEPVGRTEGVGL